MLQGSPQRLNCGWPGRDLFMGKFLHRSNRAQRRSHILLYSLVVCILSSTAMRAATYYVRLSGDNANDGLSPETAWRGIDKVNSVNFTAGDNILFEGGQTFSGNLYFDTQDRGTGANPITIGSFGTMPANINAGVETALFAYNTAGIVIKDLNFVGVGPRTNSKNGITFLTDLENVKLSGITIQRVNVSGFGHSGISIVGWNERSGYNDVHISHVAAFDNLDSGISTVARTPRAHSNIYIGYSKTFRNFGNPDAEKNTGNGIILGGVNVGMIERCVSYENGKNNTTGGEGGVGIWTYDSARVVIQFNEAHSNQTSGRTDGGGFDLDNNVQDSILQYNYSHNNDGSGLLLGTDAANTRNIIRYNISHNDGRKNGYPGMFIYGPVSNADIYNNTIILNEIAGSPPALLVQNGASNLRFRNNIFYTKGGARLIRILPGSSDLVFQGNAYHAADGQFSIVQEGVNYTSLAAWQEATGKELMGGQNVGLISDPQFIGPGRGTILNDATAIELLNGYRLRSSSPLLNQGRDLRSQFGINPGQRDFLGNSAVSATQFHPGAHAFGGASIYFQNADGRLAAWNMQDTLLAQAKILREGTRVNSSTWRAFATTDINTDGSPDVLFQNANSSVSVWLMDGTTFLSSARLRAGAGPGVEWRAVAATDLNGDGQRDVLFQNPSGQLLAWYMNGTTFLNEALLLNGQTPGVGWVAVGASDFNHDGSVDVLFQHDDGPLMVWLIKDSQFQSQPLRSRGSPTVWTIVALVDLDQDGSTDIIWRHVNGRMAVWKMNQTNFVSSAALRNGQPVAANWRVIGAR